jgi:predicted RNase H-like HicB family nuclease
MEEAHVSLTAVYLKAHGGYVGFVEELPGVNSSGRTLEEARAMLHDLAEAIFDEERRGAEALIEDKEVIREAFFL